MESGNIQTKNGPSQRRAKDNAFKTKHQEMYKIYLMKKDGREKEIVKNSVDKLCAKMAAHEEFSKSILNFVSSDEQPISDL